MNKPVLSESQEDYLKEIFKIRELNGSVGMQDLSRNLDVRPASVTGMIKKLAQTGLVKHEPYKGVILTEFGEKIALEIIRHHRLLELYLAEHLNYSWDEIHDEAERLEHVISEKFENTIAELMGHPTHDPHGDPIPTFDLKIPQTPDWIPVTRLKNHQKAKIQRVMTQDKDILNMLARLNLTIDREIELVGNDTTGLRIKVDKEQFLIPHAIARLLWVK